MSKKLILLWVSNKLKHWGVEGPRPLSGDPLSSIPSPRPISPGQRLALTSGAQGRAEGRLGGSGSHGVPSSMALGSPVNTDRCQASRSDGLSGLLA